MTPEAVISLSVGILIVGLASGTTYGIIQWFRRTRRSVAYA